MIVISPSPERKCWGEATHIFTDHHCAVSYLKVIEGSRCSKHVHRWRANQFFVTYGKIVVEEFDCQLNFIRATFLTSGQAYTVPSRVPHRFRVIESGEVIEIYWSDIIGGSVRLDDIERFDEGGVDDS